MMLPQQIPKLFAAELQDGEEIFWTGQPSPWRLFDLSDIFMIPFSLAWGGFALFWELGVLGMLPMFENHGTPSLIMGVFGLPFVLVGLWLIFGRFIHRAYTKHHTFYALTNQRVMKLITGRRALLLDERLENISEVRLSRRRNGSGSLIFVPTSVGHSPFLTFVIATERANDRESRMPIFLDIPQVQRLYELATSLHEKARHPHTQNEPVQVD